ncbi:MAG: hypothetical protein ACXAHE_05915 [Roseburia sp. 1XD42-69]
MKNRENQVKFKLQIWERDGIISISERKTVLLFQGCWAPVSKREFKKKEGLG